MTAARIKGINRKARTPKKGQKKPDATIRGAHCSHLGIGGRLALNFGSWTLPYGPATRVGVVLLLAPSQLEDLKKMRWHRKLTLSLLSSQVSILVRSHTVSATAGYTSTRFCIQCQNSAGFRNGSLLQCSPCSEDTKQETTRSSKPTTTRDWTCWHSEGVPTWDFYLAT
jgi:hypothetical protein